jgi:hypothetical protein
MNASEERLRILKLVEDRAVTAEEGARLLAALGAAAAPDPEGGPAAGRWLRVRVTDSMSGRAIVNLTLPARLLSVAAKLGGRFVPDDSGVDLEELAREIRAGAQGRILEVEDPDDGTKVEIFVE